MYGTGFSVHARVRGIAVQAIMPLQASKRDLRMCLSNKASGPEQAEHDASNHDFEFTRLGYIPFLLFLIGFF